jgi:hypothetical protein
METAPFPTGSNSRSTKFTPFSAAKPAAAENGNEQKA